MDNSFWAAVALVIFIGLIMYLKVPGKIAKSLDARAAKIRDELDEARKLREEAQGLLADFQRKRQEAEKEAGEIIAGAQREAKALREDAAHKTAEFIERRNAIAEQKIAQAETQALAEVRNTAVDVAIAAAEKIIAGKVTGATADRLIKNSIAEVKTRLN